MTRDLLALLDQLDALRRNGTPGTWGVGNETDIVTEVEQTSRGSYRYRYEVARLDDWRDQASGRPTSSDDDDDNPAQAQEDAALIVAAVNHLPKLTAALGAVLDLAAQYEQEAARVDEALKSFTRHDDVCMELSRSASANRNTANRIRTAITTALEIQPRGES